MAEIGWTEVEMRQVLATLDAGLAPQLSPDIAAAIRSARSISSEAGPAWVFDLDYGRGQQLKQWCDTHRAQATEQVPDQVWTRIVARVNEAVQPDVPATEPGHSPVRRDPRA